MTASEIFYHGHVALFNSITLLLPDPPISLLPHSSIRYFSYFVACMATVQSLRTGQRFVLPIPRREGRENEDDELVEVTMKTLQSMRQRRMLAQRPGDRVNDPDFVTALEGGPGSVKGASSLPVVVVNSDHESAEKSFSSLEGGKPDISYPWEFHPNEVAKSRKVLLDRHVTTRSTSLYGVYAPRYNTSIKAENDRTNHHEM